MTAIAILNAENDPHLVADMLLSSEGRDPRPSKKFWLPALGSIPTEWEGDNGWWYVTRLGRKCFSLPNNSGILAFSANDCGAAFRFWDVLSATFLTKVGFFEQARVDRQMVDYALHAIGHDSTLFSMIGVLIDESGRFLPYAHNEHVRVETETFGVSYVSGSGAPLLEQIIRDANKQICEQGTWPKSFPISATEDLAEHISSRMLYQEGDYRNGIDTNTPLLRSCGGFYEWHRIFPGGTKPMHPRIELHLVVEEDKLILNRAYFAEMLETTILNSDSFPTQRVALSILNLGIATLEIPIGKINRLGYTIEPDECWGTISDLTFRAYCEPGKKDSSKSQSGPVSPETLKEFFFLPFDVHRIRVVVQHGNQNPIAKRFVTSPGQSPNAVLSEMHGKLQIWISRLVLDAIGQSRH